MVNRVCKICGTNFDVKTNSNTRIYCSKDCKATANKEILKLKYHANSEEARKKAREAYYRNHDDNKERSRERMKQARFSSPDSFKGHKLKSTYGISVEEFSALLDSQGHKCLICGRQISGKVNSKDLKAFVDHDHKTGAVRGLLCVYCNSLIGYCREDKSLLLAAIGYLKKFQNLALPEVFTDGQSADLGKGGEVE
jgi:endogenous inhibitor of DNA gyrase (YacG/DUF329 family)